MAADHRSIHPHLAGVPWWAAIAIAATATAIGFAFDAGSGNKELTHVFAALYVLGCVAAVLMVQQSGVFTTVIQPPLILFCSVPGAYWLFHGATFNGVKNILINCGYPLIERFPLMLFTSAAVLIIGLVRWYLGTAARGGATAATKADAAGRPAALVAALTSLWHRATARPGDDRDQAAPRRQPRRRPTGERPTRAATSARRATATRSRDGRRPLDDAPDAVERPRRRRPEHTGRGDAAPEPRRRPREPRRDPYLRNGERRSRDPYPPPEPRQRREAAPKSTNSTHHPVSRVRYRGGPADDAPRPRAPRKSEPESWQYDI